MRAHLRSGVLLAGGESRRFGGSPKGLRPLGEARLADRPLAALQAICDTVLVASNDPAAESWFPGVPVAPDVSPLRGALSALHTALTLAAHPVVIVVAWDMPFVTAAVLAQLAAVVEGGATCCVPMHADGRAEPLCAAYDRAACLAVTTRWLQEGGDHAAHRLRDAVSGDAWPIEQHLGRDAAARIFRNVNSPADLALAHAWLDAHTESPWS